jgi:hypothetical protein
MLVDGWGEACDADSVVASELDGDAALDVMKSNDDAEAADDVTEGPDKAD